MDSVEVSELYMAEYNKLVAKYEAKTISLLLEGINGAIANSDMQRVNDCYNELSEWNQYVARIQGAGEALNRQYKHLKLPSVNSFFVVFDNMSKEWRFNTEAFS